MQEHIKELIKELAKEVGMDVEIHQTPAQLFVIYADYDRYDERFKYRVLTITHTSVCTMLEELDDLRYKLKSCKEEILRKAKEEEYVASAVETTDEDWKDVSIK